jgi:predicted PurR-regulated permease PerM
MKWENHQTLLTVIVTLIVAIFGFAQVYILFSVKQVDNRITRLDNRINERLNLIEDRLDTLTQNHINHLAHHNQEND